MAGQYGQKKRHGKHQKKTRDYLRVYSPYLPLFLIVSIGLFLSVLSPPKNVKSVLAYSTDMTTYQLLASSNRYRLENKLPALKLNGQLTTAAQAKAQDMVNRDYWSHATPDGKQPWVFISAAGYKYRLAAENLAYGFDSSNDTILGWMNSQEHRTNMLNENYTDVGFAFINAQNYVGKGHVTLVVAEYGQPLESVVTASAPVNSANQTTAKSNIGIEPETQPINRLSAITGLNLQWLSTLAATTIIVGILLLIIRHTYAIHKLIRRGEKYILNHLVFDITIAGLIVLCIIASQSVAFIK